MVLDPPLQRTLGLAVYDDQKTYTDRADPVGFVAALSHFRRDLTLTRDALPAGHPDRAFAVRYAGDNPDELVNVCNMKTNDEQAAVDVVLFDLYLDNPHVYDHETLDRVVDTETTVVVHTSQATPANLRSVLRVPRVRAYATKGQTLEVAKAIVHAHRAADDGLELFVDAELIDRLNLYDALNAELDRRARGVASQIPTDDLLSLWRQHLKPAEIAEWLNTEHDLDLTGKQVSTRIGQIKKAVERVVKDTPAGTTAEEHLEGLYGRGDGTALGRRVRGWLAGKKRR